MARVVSARKVFGHHLQALVRLDHREEHAEQLPTQHALYRGRKLRHDLIGRVHVGDDLVEEVATSTTTATTPP